MRFVLFTAVRYLFGRSHLGATGWISLLSSIAILVVTAALVCVLSVYNGYVSVLLSGESRNLPELMLKPRDGGLLALEPIRTKLSNSSVISAYSEILLSQGVLQNSQVELFAQVCGVDSTYTRVVSIEEGLLEGSFFSTQHYSHQGITPITIGIALAAEGASSSEDTHSDGLRLTFPRREGLLNPLAPASAFISQSVAVVGVLPAYNESTNRTIYMPIDTLREVLNYGLDVASAVAIKLRPGEDIAEAKRQIQELVGDNWSLLTREEQQPELTILIKTERIMVYAIMLAILVLAAFNLASSLVMLIFEKEVDIKTFYMLGASSYQVAGIFAFTGILTSTIGSLVGLLLGIVLCLLQERWGFLYSGEGINRLPFPIDIQLDDLCYVVLASVLISAMSASFPASILGRKRNNHK